MSPAKVVVAVLPIVTPLLKAAPLTIAPRKVMFAEPLMLTLTALVTAEPNLNPSKDRVFPVAEPELLAVRVAPVGLVATRVLSNRPIFKVVFVPAKLIRGLPLAVTVPVPRSRSLAEVLLVVPKIVVVANVIALFPALMTANPLVLLIVDPALVMRVPVPSALALLMFRTAAPPMLTPPDAPELSPLKVNVPADAVVNPAYVLFPERVAVPDPVLVKAPDPAKIAEMVPALVSA